MGLVRRTDSGEGDHRQSWWETSQAAIEPDLDEGKTSGLETEVAIRRASVQSYADAYRRYLGNYGTIPKEWHDSEIGFDSVLRLIPSELDVLRAELDGVLSSWQEKSRNHSEGDGSEQVLVIVSGFVWSP